MEYSPEQLNYFRLCHVVFTLVPEGLRQIFKQQWNFRYKTSPLGEWKDTPQNGHDFCNGESRRSRIENARYLALIQNGNTAEWDLSCLFFAILYSVNIGNTLSLAVRSAVDDLHQLRNVLEIPDLMGKLTNAEFQNFMGRVSNAFKSLGLSVNELEDIRNQVTFPTEEVRSLKTYSNRNLRRELAAIGDSLDVAIEGMETRTEELSLKLESFSVPVLKPTHGVIRRSNDVERILNKMQEVSIAANGVVSTIYLSGPPGCGKTQLAIQLGDEFFSRRSDNTQDITFVATLNAENMETLYQSYATVYFRYLIMTEYTLSYLENSKELTLGEKIQHLQRLISLMLPKIRQYSKWLIIVDNVLDLTSVGNFLPQTGSKEWGHGQVLVITQDSSAVPHNTSYTFHESLSEGMQPEDAVTLLEKVSQVSDKNLADVARLLGYQPLALAVVAHYVRNAVNNGRPNYSWAIFLEEFTRRQDEATENVLLSVNASNPKTAAVHLKMALQITLEADEVLRHTLSFFTLRASKTLPLDVVVEFVKSKITDKPEKLIKSTILSSPVLVLNEENDEQSPSLVLHNLVYALLERGDISVSPVPSEIKARGARAQLAYVNALKHGKVKVYRARIMLLGQDRAGKTSLKNSFLGQPFNPGEPSTVGITIDPSKFEIDVDQVKHWQRIGEKPFVSQFANDLATMVAEELEKEQPISDNDGDQVMNVEQIEENIDVSQPSNDFGKIMAEQVEEGEASSAGQHEPKKPPNREEATTNVATVQEEFVVRESVISDPALPPEEVTQLLIQRLEGLNLQSEAASVENYVTLDLWDFAGQHLYYTSYPVFLSSKAVYVLIYNMSKELQKTAEPCVRVGGVDSHLRNPSGETNLENLLSWLVTVVTMCSGQPTANHIRPAVFIVGTHADNPCRDIQEMESQIKRELLRKDLDHHVIRGVIQDYFSVDNTLGSSCHGVRALQKKMIEVLMQESYMGEERPVRWFLFEKVIQALVDQLKTYSVNLKQLKGIIQKQCFITNEDEVDAMLDFYHDLGIIVKHGSTVVLRAQWLIDVFRQLITIRSYKDMSGYSRLWKELEDTGVLSMELVEHVFSKFGQQGVIREDILDLMEKFGLITKFQYSPGNEQYFVPSLLKTPPDPLCYQEPSPSDPCALYIHFLGGFVPHGLYSQLVSRCTKWCSDSGVEYAPNFFNGASRFIVEKEFLHQLILLCKKRFIKIILKLRKCSDQEAPTEGETAKLVHGFLEDALRKMTGELPWLNNLKYKLCVECPYCPTEKYPCRNHGKVSCNHEDCICLLPLPARVQPLYCQKNFLNETLKPVNLGKWFSVKDEEMPVSASSMKIRSSSYTPQQSKKRRLEHAGSVKDGNPSDYELEGLSQKIVHWKSLGRRLNFHEAELHGFHNENSEWHEKVYAMLRKWKKGEGKDATYQVLYDALCHEYVKCKDLAEEFCWHVEGK